ncbi:MAG: HD domain-containing protein [Clostridia bacterium]|nr:HD domain-containing protein [Clostridia bacterium]
MIHFSDIVNNPEIKAYIRAADASLSALGYTEHSFAHVGRVSDVAANILLALGRDARTVELAKMAGYLHDIGNLVNRVEHSQSGAVMAFTILRDMGMPPEEIAEITTAIGNHDEGTGVPVSDIAAALIIADKSDVRRSRVRNSEEVAFDIHDRVNYSVTKSSLNVDKEGGTLTLKLSIDETVGTVSDYFEIFLERMLMCRRAAQKLSLAFKLTINGITMM